MMTEYVLPPLPSQRVLRRVMPDDYRYGDVCGYTEGQLQAYARAAIEAYRKQHFENGDALQRYKECGGDEESDPVERLRFYCSLAMSGQDWLDVEPFFDALVADLKTFLQSQDREDAKRLDFLEKGWFWKDSRGCWNFSFNECWDAGQHDSLREAIDTHQSRIKGDEE